MAQRDDRGVLVIGVHFMSLELGGRAMGLCQPMMAMYRPHNNKAMEWAQTKGRMRSNKAMIDRKDLRGMVHALKRGEAVWFAPDQDYGPRGSVFAPLFAVDQAATTSGTFMLARMANPALVPVVLIRRERGRGYDLLIQPAPEDYPLRDEQAAAAYEQSDRERSCGHRSNTCGCTAASKLGRSARPRCTNPLFQPGRRRAFAPRLKSGGSTLYFPVIFFLPAQERK